MQRLRVRYIDADGDARVDVHVLYELICCSEASLLGYLVDIVSLWCPCIG